MHGHRIGYIRVSTLEQNPERQLDAIAVDRTFTDTASGKDARRPQLAALLGFARAGDTVLVHIVPFVKRPLIVVPGHVRRPDDGERAGARRVPFAARRGPLIGSQCRVVALADGHPPEPAWPGRAGRRS